MDKRREYELLYAKFNEELPKLCANCNKNEDLVIHHIVPLCYGGKNVITNVVRLCSDCHAKAHGGSSFIKATHSSRKRNASKGKWPAGSIPYGYKSNNGNLEIDETSAEIVRFIFKHRYENEFGLSYISDLLNLLAIPPARYGKEWSHIAVRKILNNEVYFGNLIYKGNDYGELITPLFDVDMRSKMINFEMKYGGKRVPARKIDAQLGA